jgi:hypothetical protein
MAIGVIWKPPIDAATYDAIKERVMQAAIDRGSRFHAAGESPSGWRIIEIWDSREGLEAFMRDSLDPAVQEVSGGQAPPMEEPEVFEVYFEATAP